MVSVTVAVCVAIILLCAVLVLALVLRLGSSTLLRRTVEDRVQALLIVGLKSLQSALVIVADPHIGHLQQLMPWNGSAHAGRCVFQLGGAMLVHQIGVFLIEPLLELFRAIEALPLLLRLLCAGLG